MSLPSNGNKAPVSQSSTSIDLYLGLFFLIAALLFAAGLIWEYSEALHLKQHAG